MQAALFYAVNWRPKLFYSYTLHSLPSANYSLFTVIENAQNVVEIQQELLKMLWESDKNCKAILARAPAQAVPFFTHWALKTPHVTKKALPQYVRNH